MSKAQLTKLLRKMSAEDLSDLLLQLYDAHKEAKDFLEFYLKPDINAKLEKAQEAIARELARSRRRRFAVRISQIKAVLRNFAVYQPDDIMLSELYFNTFKALIDVAKHTYSSRSFRSGLGGYLAIMLEVFRSTGTLSDNYPIVCEIVRSFPDRYYDNRATRLELEDALNNYITTHPFD